MGEGVVVGYFIDDTVGVGVVRVVVRVDVIVVVVVGMLLSLVSICGVFCLFCWGVLIVSLVSWLLPALI